MNCCPWGIAPRVWAGVQDFKRGDRLAVAGASFASHVEMIWGPKISVCLSRRGWTLKPRLFVMLGGIALHGVREAGLILGETAVVIGLGLLGLLSRQLLVAQGCRVIGVDLDRQKCELARELGADLALIPVKPGLFGEK